MKTNIVYNDCELLALLAQESQHAFELLYRKYWQSLYDEAYQRLNNPQQAEDIVQDVFVSIWTRRASLSIDDLPAYLHTAVRFRVFNYITRDLASSVFYEPFEMILDGHSGADDPLRKKELIELIRLYAATLPEKRKQIFLLHLSETLSTREIADRLQISQKTVQNQLGKVLHGLRRRIAQLGVFLSL